MRRKISQQFIERFDLPPDVLYVWGRKPSGRSIHRLACRTGQTVVALEDGFLRSLGLGGDDAALSLCIDDLGIYYDSTTASRLERLIQEPISREQAERARELQQSWCRDRLSKYNGALESQAPQGEFVLVVDQTVGDLSIVNGQANRQSFEHMLESALTEWPDHQIVVKIHPDVVHGRKKSHFRRAQLRNPRIQISRDGGHPCALLESCSAVYAVTSQLGFEGLLWGKPVYTFGMPFYAGWGLTHDALVAPARRQSHKPTLEQLVDAALIRYPVYRHPDEPGQASAEEVMAWIAQQRKTMLALPQHLEAFGFTPWKARQLKRFIPRGRGQTLRFRHQHARPRAGTDAAVIWGNRIGRGLEGSSIAKIRVEDGFIRSVGLGANLIPPQSWILDRQGMYYDSSKPNELESYLRTAELTAEERQRAQQIRQKLCRRKVSKYNLSGKEWEPPAACEGRESILVLGQVDDDASIRFGLPPESKVCTNENLLREVRKRWPAAWLVYKPHPDVEAGLRASKLRATNHAQLWDECITNACIHSLFARVNRVCTLTSLGGFEALMHGTAVSVWGLPFYAGWGLTDDVLANHAFIRERRCKQLDLETLIHGALVHYPRYISKRSGLSCSVETVLNEIETITNQPSMPLTLEQQLFRWWGAGISHWRAARANKRHQ
jgi:capsular polysaccharide export protein